jgi:hypothetical protein
MVWWLGCLPLKHAFEPYSGHNHLSSYDSSACWFQEMHSKVILVSICARTWFATELKTIRLTKMQRTLLFRLFSNQIIVCYDKRQRYCLLKFFWETAIALNNVIFLFTNAIEISYEMNRDKLTLPNWPLRQMSNNTKLYQQLYQTLFERKGLQLHFTNIV